ncbi:HAD superfamily hydrolase [Spiroplasma helicoides]|uniref:HAD superfamily hydrolase n=1 Tax=Spiroplasma helicoides TaxID=216938 RepID=A0A1B3SJI8_9MOLU|nr:HAD family hydrolase [Spiroplasma helicoides]AOG60092.1 HAD superfamily hydrolase [Spiroplasma helicoides]
MIKLITLDIDGTLLGKKKKVSSENIKAINEARKKGIKICIASGRALNRVDEIAHEIGVADSQEYVITMNGAAIYKYDENKKPQLIQETLFPIEDVIYIYNAVLENGANCFSYSYDPDIAYIIRDKGLFIWFMKKISHRTIRIYEKDKMDQKAYKIIIYGKKKQVDKIKKQLEKRNYEIFSWSYVSGNTANLEVNPNGVDKLYALQDLAKLENIQQEEIMYFGDGDNDKKVISWAGHGVAMKNASKDIKDIADHITGHHKKSGVAKKIYEYLEELENAE